MTLIGSTCKIELPSYALAALDALEQAGFEAWCVGGYIRDAIRGAIPKDIDIATSAHWEDVKHIFAAQGCKTFETGVKHGTITVAIEGALIEITTFRNESTYSDLRHPDEVTFVDTIEQDLARRDFTMNALAYHPKRGICDPFGGLPDIEARLIRAVGDPSVRFSEDALRMVRGCRFASQLGFSLEKDTFTAMEKCRGLLDHIAVERIAAELDGFFCGEYIRDALMKCVAVIGQVIPETLDMKDFDQRTPYHIYDVLEHTAYCMQNCPRKRLVRWAAFFHDIGKPPSFFTDEEGIGHFYGHAKISVDIAKRTMRHLKMSPTFIHKVLLLVEHHDDVIHPSTKAVKRALRRFDEDPELFRVLCALKKGDALSQAPHCHGRVQLAEELEDILDAILASNDAFSLKDLAIKGNDILNLGVLPGPQIGLLLNKALDAVIEGTVANTHTDLLAYVRKIMQ